LFVRQACLCTFIRHYNPTTSLPVQIHFFSPFCANP